MKRSEKRDPEEVGIASERAFLLAILYSFDPAILVASNEIMRLMKELGGLEWSRQRFWKAVKAMSVKREKAGKEKWIELEGLEVMERNRMRITEAGRRLWENYVGRQRWFVLASGVRKVGVKEDVEFVARIMGREKAAPREVEGGKRDYVLMTGTSACAPRREDAWMCQKDPVDENQMTEEEQVQAKAGVRWKKEGSQWIGLSVLFGPGELVVAKAGNSWSLFFERGEETLPKDAFEDEKEDPQWRHGFGSQEEAMEKGAKWVRDWVRIKKAKEEDGILTESAIQP